MKAKYSFEIMDLEDGLVAVPVGDGAEQFHGVLKVNESAVEILKLLEQETSEDAIVETLRKEYEGEKETIAEYVHSFIVPMKNEGVVE